MAIADAFTSVGASVYVWGGRRAFEKKSNYAVYKSLDLSKNENIYEAFAELKEYPDILVNCAGITKGAFTTDFDDKTWEDVIRINLTVPFILSKLVAKKLIEAQKAGSIINITSIGAELGFPDNPAYGAAKGGLKQLSKAMACDLSPHRIRVNNVAPGYTRTRMTEESWKDVEKRKQRTDRMMIGRWAVPEDVAAAVLFLASDMAEYITGQDIYVDGGWTAKGL